MNELHVLIRKEIVEMSRSYKWIWMPLLFISLGIMQPLTSYYLSDILEQFGGLPEGAVINIPPPPAEQVFSETLGQFSQIGTLIVVLAIMGMLCNERISGIALMILVKPISYTNYFLAKWISAVALVLVSFWAGVAASLYYIHLLFDSLDWSNVLNGISLYSLWLLFVVTLVLMLSTLLKQTGTVAASSILLLISLSILPSIFKEPLKWSPGNLLSLAHSAIAGESLVSSGGAVLITLFLIGGMGTAAILYVKKREWLR